MKFSAAIVLLSAHCAYGLVSTGPRLSGVTSSRSTKLFSSSAAAANMASVSVGNTVGLGAANGAGDVVAASTNGAAAISTEENVKINYGPGELAHISCVLQWHNLWINTTKDISSSNPCWPFAQNGIQQ